MLVSVSFRAAQGQPLDQQLFHRMALFSVDQGRGHAGGGDGHLSSAKTRQQQRHIEIAEIHLSDAPGAMLEKIRQKKSIPHGIKEALDQRHHDAGPGAMPGGISHHHGEGAVGVMAEIIIIASDLAGGLHIHSDFQAGHLRQLLRQHGKLQFAGLFQFAGFTSDISFQQPVLDLLLTG